MTDAVTGARHLAPNIHIIASGGIRHGLILPKRYGWGRIWPEWRGGYCNVWKMKMANCAPMVERKNHRNSGTNPPVLFPDRGKICGYAKKNEKI